MVSHPNLCGLSIEMGKLLVLMLLTSLIWTVGSRSTLPWVIQIHMHLLVVLFFLWCVCVCQRTDSGVILKYAVQVLGQGLIDSSSGIWLEGLIEPCLFPSTTMADIFMWILGTELRSSLLITRQALD